MYVTESYLESNKIQENFFDINASIEVEKILKDYSDRAKSDYLGFDLMTDLKSELENKISEVQKFTVEKQFSLSSVIEEMETELTDNRKSLSIKSIPSINFSSGGFKPQNLIGLAGAFKNGKTTLAINILIDLLKQDIPCGYFTLELSESEFKQKNASVFFNVGYGNLREPTRLTAEHKERMIKAIAKKDEYPLYISDMKLTETEIYNKAKYWKERNGVQAVFIDDIGNMSSKKRFEKKEQQAAYYSNFLKQLAKELNLVVFTAAQLNRTGIGNPTVINLADSIALARDCDFLFLIYNLFEAGIKQINGTTFNENHFACKLEVTRHSKNSRKEFILEMTESGQFKEIATGYDIKQIESVYKPFYTKNKIDIGRVNNYYETESMPF
ncbi:MAG: hypothetical protein NTX22_04460 [Ignavibacteriales bacterium]|nr:hypothetical protein [Ignavibacteriales bacterium]